MFWQETLSVNITVFTEHSTGRLENLDVIPARFN